jgi:geranylgeranyl reductase family protein
MQEIYDVTIVGAGPAGGAAAFFLGQAGKRVLVLEKETLPRYKTCGGAISEQALKIFPFSFDHLIESRVEATSYALGSQTITLPMPDLSLCMVMREPFDAYLLSQAKAEVCQGVAVQRVEEKEDRVLVHTRQGETFASRYLIAADGANSTVARSLGLRRSRTLAAGLEVEAPASPQLLQRFANTPLFVFGEARWGYLWIFPKADHLSVGIGALHPRPGELQATLKRVMRRYGISLEGQPLHGHPLPFYLRQEPISTRRCLLAGDAAGLVDPFNGEGIRFAIKSGRLAAGAILAGRVEAYPAGVQRQIGFNHRLALGLGRLFYRFPRACYLLGVRNPFTTQAFLDQFSDRAGYLEVILRMFGTLPVFFGTEGLASLAGLLAGPRAKQRVRTAVYPGLGGL